MFVESASVARQLAFPGDGSRLCPGQVLWTMLWKTLCVPVYGRTYHPLFVQFVILLPVDFAKGESDMVLLGERSLLQRRVEKKINRLI